MSTHVTAQAISAHYSRAGLADTLLEALKQSGKNPEAPTLDDLAPIDQFHTRGKAGTLDLAERAGLSAGMRVLDVGGGLGGAARLLAQQYGCSVVVLDITAEYCQVGALLTERCGLSEQVTFQHGSALEMPFPDGDFDLVWTQHSTMNIADKQTLYREIRRVLRPGGRMAMHEIMAGADAPHFPVPWARQPEISHLSPAEEIRDLLRDLGFVETLWLDESEQATGWFRERLAVASQPGSRPPLGLHLLLGDDFGLMFRNQVRNLEEGRIRVVQAVLQLS